MGTTFRGHLRQRYFPIGQPTPVDISNTLVFLASDEGRYITGITLPVDAGSSQE